MLACNPLGSAVAGELCVSVIFCMNYCLLANAGLCLLRQGTQMPLALEQAAQPPSLKKPGPAALCKHLVVCPLLLCTAGGTIAPGGGYVAGKEALIGAVAARLAAPGIGIDAGGVPGTTLRIMFQGG